MIYQWKHEVDRYAAVQGADETGFRALASGIDPNDIDEPVHLQVTEKARNFELPLGDMPYIGAAVPKCLSERAYTALEHIIGSQGISKKATIDGQPFVLFWPTVVADCFDSDQSDILTTKYGYRQLRKPVFFDTVKNAGPIFLVPELGDLCVFINEQVVEIIKDAMLTGMEIRTPDYDVLLYSSRTMAIEEIRSLAAELCNDSGVDTITAYLIKKKEQEPNDNELNRLAGSPIGTSEDAWPRFGNHKMHHILTLDLETTPTLKPVFKSDTRAVALFLSDIVDHEALTPGSEHVSVVQLTQQQIDMGVNKNIPAYDDEFISSSAASFSCHEVILPQSVFDPDYVYSAGNKQHEKLQDAIWEYDFAAGEPLWLHDDYYSKPFVLQFSEELVDINMGDGGLMYMFIDTAFIQSH